MKVVKIFSSCRMTSEVLNNSSAIQQMNEEINTLIYKWIIESKILEYDIVNSQITSTDELNMKGFYSPSMIIISTHISYLEE